jgi:mannan endo-1,4-beta-mannosidase
VQTGLKVLRVWGFNDVATIPAAGTVWFQSFVSGESPTINTGADGLQRLDYVVQSAEAHGVSLIINFVNYWDNYGGQPLYVSYYDIAAKTSTAIFAWELCNEPRCPGYVFLLSSIFFAERIYMENFIALY